MFKFLKAVNNSYMIKLHKNIKITKNFTMEYPTTQVLQSNIAEQDISAMFCGVFKLMQMQAKQKANAELLNSNNAYKFLLNMYLQAVKNMNKYKTLYFENLNKTKS